MESWSGVNIYITRHNTNLYIERDESLVNKAAIDLLGGVGREKNKGTVVMEFYKCNNIAILWRKLLFTFFQGALNWQIKWIPKSMGFIEN